MSETKKCANCEKLKPLTEFHKNRSKKNGTTRRCKVCRNAYNRARRKTIRAFIQETYSEMKKRVNGQTRDRHLYEGLKIVDKETFYEWAYKHEELLELFREWVEAGHPYRLTPVPDRIDPRFGYELINLQWSTVSQNATRANTWRWRGKII